MPFVKLKGLNKVTTRLADGRVATYWYAWKGGPRLQGKPGEPAFVAAYNAAVADRRGSQSETLAGLVVLYRSKPEFLTLAASTQAEWNRWLNRLSAHDIGSLSHRALDDRRVRMHLLEWRDEFSDRPRTADYGMQVLSRVLGFAVDRGLLTHNHAANIPHLYEANRADQIWSAEEIEAFCGKASLRLGQALRLACLTGLRRGDLVKLQWKQVGDLVISRATGKSSGTRVATIPLLNETRALLADIGRGEPDETVLTNTRGKPWSPAGLTHQMVDASKLAGVEKTLHDARGTFATRLRLAGLALDEVAEVMGWKLGRVSQVITRYVEQDEIIRSLADRIQANGSGTKTPK